jgi:glycine dehydrogenase
VGRQGLTRAWPRRRSFVPRHNSTTPEELSAMVKETGFDSMDALIDATVPKAIRRSDGMGLGKYTEGMTESQFLDYFK